MSPLARPPQLRLAGLLALAFASAPGPAHAGPDPFSVTSLAMPGRPFDALAVRVPGERAALLVVAGVEGSPPDETRRLRLFALAGDGGFQPVAVRTVPERVVAFDVAALRPGGEPVLALLSSEALELQDLRSGSPLGSRRFAPPLPLPPRTRGLARIPFLGSWNGDGTSALVPSLAGLALVPLPDGPIRSLAFPVRAEYLPGLDDAGVHPGSLLATIGWPELALGDDDGDGRPDLLALSRYHLAVYRSGPDGLPDRPSREATLRPFSDEEELRPETTSVSLFARDLDGDGRADLVVHRTVGALLRSDATTRFWRNPGPGADPTAPPDAVIATSGGFGSIFLEDLDGDGRTEAVQLFVPFGVIQLVRALLTETVQAKLRVYRLGAPGIAGAEPCFEEDLTVALAAGEGRIAGILPTVRGDWNGDGLRDLLAGESLERIALRVGERGPDGPRFGSVVARQQLPPSDRALVADFDGDGLDDLATYDTRRLDGGVHVLRNLGVLPPATGAPRVPELRPPAPHGEGHGPTGTGDR
jgi:hypothetical protein